MLITLTESTFRPPYRRARSRLHRLISDYTADCRPRPTGGTSRCLKFMAAATFPAPRLAPARLKWQVRPLHPRFVWKPSAREHQPRASPTVLVMYFQDCLIRLRFGNIRRLDRLPGTGAPTSTGLFARRRPHSRFPLIGYDHGTSPQNTRRRPRRSSCSFETPGHARLPTEHAPSRPSHERSD